MLEDYHSADIDPKLRAMLGFVAKLTREPDEIGPDDIEALRAAGLSDRAIEDAVLVCAGFNVIARVADALEFRILDKDGFVRGAEQLLRRGYG